MKAREFTYFIMGMALFLLGISNVHSSTVPVTVPATIPLTDFRVVSGETRINYEIDLEPGIYKATLVDFLFPSPFETLTLGITQNTTPLGIVFDTDSLTFNVMDTMADMEKIVARLVAVPGTGGMGTYGLHIKAIPIPPAALLLFSGLIGLVLVGRRTNRLSVA